MIEKKNNTKELNYKGNVNYRQREIGSSHKKAMLITPREKGNKGGRRKKKSFLKNDFYLHDFTNSNYPST